MFYLSNLSTSVTEIFFPEYTVSAFTFRSLIYFVHFCVKGGLRFTFFPHEYPKKRCLLLRRKAMTNPDRVLKSRDITLPTKVHIVKAMAFLVVKYGCES